MDDELKRLLEAIRQETAAARQESVAARQESAAARQESVAARQESVAARQESAAARQESVAAREETAAARQESVAAHQETRRHFDIAVERMEDRFGLLAETVQHLSEETLRTRASLDEKIERSAAETQAMIKFSHKELDRRLTALEEGQRALEETVAHLQTRLDRVESGTH